MLVGKDSKSNAILAYLVSQKGIDFQGCQAVINRAVHDLNLLGYKRVLFKSDQENAILALLREIRRAWPGEVVPEEAATGESQSNGGAEVSVRLLEGMVRTLKDALETRIGQQIPTDHPVLSWVIQHAAATLMRYSIAPDGRSSYERLRGKKAAQPPAEFCEQIWWMPMTPTHLRYRPWGLGLRTARTWDLSTALTSSR